MGESIFTTSKVPIRLFREPGDYSNNNLLNINVKATFLWENFACFATAQVMVCCVFFRIYNVVGLSAHFFFIIIFLSLVYVIEYFVSKRRESVNASVISILM